jgi:hypothetical protein
VLLASLWAAQAGALPVNAAVAAPAARIRSIDTALAATATAAPCVSGTIGRASVDGARPSMRERVAADGSLRGYSVVLPSGVTTRRLALPAESFLATPHPDVALLGADDGRTSRVDAHHLPSGCSRTLVRSADVVRAATLTADGRPIWHQVQRGTRRDLGVWTSGARGVARRILPPLDVGAAPARFGRTYSTSLGWSADGLLVVQSCGEWHCRTRVADVATSRVERYEAPGQGELIGVDAERLIAYAPCGGFPCPVISIARADGRMTVIEPAAGPERRREGVKP